MKKNLLLTTALVAFALPAYAGDVLGQGEWSPKTAEDVAKLENVANHDVRTFKDKGGNLSLIFISGGLNAAVSPDATFTGNKADSGGVFGVSRYNSSSLNIGKATFTGNEAYLDGGAIANYGILDLQGTIFSQNTAQASTKDASGADVIPMGGGALALGSLSTTTITGAEFTSNTSYYNGGAIATRDESNDDRDNSKGSYSIASSEFTSNTASKKGGAIYNSYYNNVSVTGSNFNQNSAKQGGAIFNDGTPDDKGNGGVMTITSSTFTSNTASDNGGAIFNTEKAVINFNGTNVFTGNTVNKDVVVANDIYNEGTINVSGDLTLDGGIAGTGHVEFNGATLTAKLDKTTIAANTVTIKESTLNLILGDDVKVGKHDFVTATEKQEGIFDISNTLYKITHLETGEINVETKSTTEISDSLGVTANEANALIAATSASSSNQYFNDVANALSAAAQSGDASAAKEAQKLGADANPVVASQEAGSHEVLFTVVNNELGGESGAMAGMSSGDVFKKASAWIRGLFNKADHEATSKTSGFNADTYGVAMGIDKEVNSNTRLGFGYANSQTDIESDGRDTDVETNSLFLYSQYKPANWYVNTVLAYSWSEYDETKYVMGANAGAKYDVDTIALQAMYGYETKFKNHDLTPEFGFRYLHTEQDAYTDKLGTTVGKNSEDILTLVAGVKVAKNYQLDSGAVLRPEVKAAVTYDLFDANNSANVSLANGAGYVVDGEKLNRLGFEFGAKVTTKATDKVELSAGYLTRVREDYQDHTVTLDAKYNF